MSWQEPAPEPARFIGVWEPLPPGFDPVAPLADQSVSLSPQSRLAPLMMSGPDSLPAFRDPRVGAFVPRALPPTPAYGLDGRMHPPHLLTGNSFFRGPSTSYLTHPFSIGISCIGDADAGIGGDWIEPIHGPLPNDTASTNEPSVEVVLP